MDRLSLLYRNRLRLNSQVSIFTPLLGDLIETEDATPRLDLYEKYYSIMITSVIDVADVLWYESQIWYEDIESDWMFFVQRAISGDKHHDVIIRDKGFSVTESNCTFVNDDYRDALNYFFRSNDANEVSNNEYIVLSMKGKDGKNHFVIRSLITEGDNFILLKDSFQLTEPFYYKTVNFLREVNWYSNKGSGQYVAIGDLDMCPTKRGKKMLLEECYRRRKHPKKGNIDLASIVSSLEVRGQDHDKLLTYPIYTIYDMYYRLSKVDNYQETMQTLHSGYYDIKKHPIDFDKINWSAIIKRD